MTVSSVCPVSAVIHIFFKSITWTEICVTHVTLYENFLGSSLMLLRLSIVDELDICFVVAVVLLQRLWFRIKYVIDNYFGFNMFLLYSYVTSLSGTGLLCDFLSLFFCHCHLSCDPVVVN